MEPTISRAFTLCVPGGVAGQLFAIGYASWIALKRGGGVHINFHDVGSRISRLGVGGVVDSDVAKSLGITYSATNEPWPPASATLPKRPILSFASAIMARINWEISDTAAISSKTLLSVPAGSTICGYPTDYRIIEESWGSLASMIAASNYKDFAHNTGKDDTVAVHWRLGDYVQNNFHGAVAWSSLRNCLRYANPDGMPVRIFTDSPELAEQTIRESQNPTDHEIISADIWSDLFEMTRSRVFIGTNSGISFLATLALRSDNAFSTTWLPNNWFMDRRAQQTFELGPETEKGSAFYPSRLVSSLMPI